MHGLSEGAVMLFFHLPVHIRFGFAVLLNELPLLGSELGRDLDLDMDVLISAAGSIVDVLHAFTL